MDHAAAVRELVEVDRDAKRPCRVISERVLPPKSGHAERVARGDYVRITDLEGQQVVDLALFNAANLRERLSTSYSRSRYTPAPGDAYKPRDQLCAGSVLRSTGGASMATMVEETPEPPGVHDVHNRLCNRQLYESYGEPQDGCLEIIAACLSSYGLDEHDVPDTVDLFMNYHHDCETGGWRIDPPVSHAGDYVTLRAEMDLLVALSNCPCDRIAPVNAYACTPVKIEVLTAS